MAIGVGVTDLPISTPILIASVLGLADSAAVWWIYFDSTVIFGEQALAAEPEETRPTLARDAYTFLHFRWWPAFSHVGFKWRTAQHRADRPRRLRNHLVRRSTDEQLRHGSEHPASVPNGVGPL